MIGIGGDPTDDDSITVEREDSLGVLLRGKKGKGKEVVRPDETGLEMDYE